MVGGYAFRGRKCVSLESLRQVQGKKSKIKERKKLKDMFL